LQVTLTNAIGCNSINILVKGRWKKWRRPLFKRGGRSRKDLRHFF
jgi:hypothetical protein